MMFKTISPKRAQRKNTLEHGYPINPLSLREKERFVPLCHAWKALHGPHCAVTSGITLLSGIRRYDGLFWDPICLLCVLRVFAVNIDL
jgi:hypothetical protein